MNTESKLARMWRREAVGAVEALDVELLGMGVGAADGGVREWPDAGQDEEDAGEQVGSDAGFLAVLVPAVFEVRLGEVLV